GCARRAYSTLRKRLKTAVVGWISTAHPRSPSRDFEWLSTDDEPRVPQARVNPPLVRALFHARCGCRSTKAIGRLDQFALDARLEGRMSGVGDDAQVGFRPGPVQVPRAACGTDDVIAALHDHRRNV